MHLLRFPFNIIDLLSYIYHLIFVTHCVAFTYNSHADFLHRLVLGEKKKNYRLCDKIDTQPVSGHLVVSLAPPASAPQPFPASQGDGGCEHTTAITMTFPQAQGARNAEERQ